MMGQQPELSTLSTFADATAVKTNNVVPMSSGGAGGSHNNNTVSFRQQQQQRPNDTSSSSSTATSRTFSRNASSHIGGGIDHKNQPTTTTITSSEQYAMYISIFVFIMNTCFLLYFHTMTTTIRDDRISSSSSWLSSSIIHKLITNDNGSSIANVTQHTSSINTKLTYTNYSNNDPSESNPATHNTDNSNIDYYYYYPNVDMIFFTSMIIMAFELLDFITKNCGKWFHMHHIPVRGKHLDNLRSIDYYCIAFSKANTAPFTYFYLRYCYFHPLVIWDIHSNNSLSTLLQTTIVPIIVLFLLFDLFYSIFHGVLHLQYIYPYIHKHHHIQKAPSRANIDAINVHPIEFIGGEYNHLLVLYIYTTLFQCQIHIISALLFLVVGGLLAGINHTRYDFTIVLPLPNIMKLVSSTKRESNTASTNIVYWTIYDSKSHDVHHRIPQSNYGQYFMLWDYIMGSYRPYNPNDRINQDAQLDPKTGKSLSNSTKAKSQ